MELTCRRVISSATSGSSAQSRVACPSRATWEASAVPHAPAPMTANVVIQFSLVRASRRPRDMRLDRRDDVLPSSRRPDFGGSVLVLEGQLHLRAIGDDLAVLEAHVELADLCDPQVAQRLRR